MNTMAGLHSITTSILNVYQECYEIVLLWAKIKNSCFLGPGGGSAGPDTWHQTLWPAFHPRPHMVEAEYNLLQVASDRLTHELQPSQPHILNTWMTAKTLAMKRTLCCFIFRVSSGVTKSRGWQSYWHLIATKCTGVKWHRSWCLFFLHCMNFVDVSIYITYFFKIFQYYFTIKENKAP